MIARTCWIIVVAAAVVSFVAGWSINGWRRDSAEQAAIEAAIAKSEAAYKQRDASFAEVLARDQASTAQNAQLKQQIIDQALALQAATRGLQLLETKGTEHDQSADVCTDSRRGTTYRLCFNAAVSGDAASVAACEAERGHGAVRGE